MAVQKNFTIVKNLLAKSESEVVVVMFNHMDQKVIPQLNPLISYLSENVRNISILVKTYEEGCYKNIFQKHDRNGEYIVRKDAYSHWYITNTLLLVYDNSPTNVDNFMQSVWKKRERKHLNSFLVLFMDIKTSEANWQKKIFERFWNLSVLNVLLIYPKEYDMTITTYTRFTDDKKISMTNLTVEGIRKEVIFSRVLNLHKHTLRISKCKDEFDHRTFTCLKTIDGNLSETLKDR